jgi:hypothetical protein
MDLHGKLHHVCRLFGGLIAVVAASLGAAYRLPGTMPVAVNAIDRAKSPQLERIGELSSPHSGWHMVIQLEDLVRYVDLHWSKADCPCNCCG